MMWKKGKRDEHDGQNIWTKEDDAQDGAINATGRKK